MTNFEKGDIVYLKSGSPQMTVSGIEELEGEVICVWFDGKKKYIDTFDPATLTTQDPKPLLFDAT